MDLLFKAYAVDAQFQFIVNQKQHGLSLIECLESCIPYLQPSQSQSLIGGGLITKNGDIVLLDECLALGDHIHYTVPNYQEAEVDTNWKLLWQNESLAAVHKPANLPVSRTTRNVYNTLVQLLRRESEWPDAHLLHRLDLETSGIILVAYDNEKAKHFQPRIAELMSKKVYRAIVHGEPNWQHKQYSNYLNTKSGSPIRCQMHEVIAEKGKYSETHFTVLSSRNGFSLVECELKTGRKHQIRAHLSQLGHPIVGDKIYSEAGAYYLKRLDDALTMEDLKNWPAKHHLLHAYKVELNPIWQSGCEPLVTIQDDHYSHEWRHFYDYIF